ncbi:MAG: carboxypeptidase regulatory-like domain-containing protein [Polyangiaceae bacterium]
MLAGRRARALVGWVCALVIASVSMSALAFPVRVRGATHIDLLATDGASGSVVRGEITDDAGASVSKVSIHIAAFDASGNPVRLDPPLPCDRPRATVPKSDATGWVVESDDRGAFCVKRAKSSSGLTFKVRFAGNSFLDPAEEATESVPDSERRVRTILRFDAPPTEIDLDREETTVSVSLKLDRLDAEKLSGSGPVKRDGLVIAFTDESGADIGTSTTSGDGRARFTLPPAKMGTPGNGELRAKFAGNNDLAPASTTIYVTRTASVRLQPESTLGGEPESGIPLTVKVKSDHGTVDSGLVEALLDKESVGSASVKDGTARLTVTFAAGRRGSASLSLRYVPQTPWWRAAKPLDFSIPVKGPSPWRHIVLGLLVALLTAWIVAKWRRAPRQAKPESNAAPPPSGRPEILVVERPSGLRGWKGIVTDAHDGSPIEHAHLSVIVPSPDGSFGPRVLAETHSDNMGAFAIELDPVEGARLVVDGDLHAEHEQALPPPSVLRVALVTRRRALLDRLVRWAKARGGSYDSTREPTPGHVRRVANRAQATEIESWARQLERAAFGDAPVTRGVDTEVQQLEPNRVARADDPRAVHVALKAIDQPDVAFPSVRDDQAP